MATSTVPVTPSELEKVPVQVQMVVKLVSVATAVEPSLLSTETLNGSEAPLMVAVVVP